MCWMFTALMTLIPASRDLQHVLPPFGVLAALDVRVGQFVDDDDLRMGVQDALQIHLFEFFAFVEQFATRNDGKPRHQGFGVGTSVRFDIADLHIHAHFEQLVCLLQHPVRLAYAGDHTDVDFEFAPVRTLDQIEEVLYALFLIHKLIQHN